MLLVVTLLSPPIIVTDLPIIAGFYLPLYLLLATDLPKILRAYGNVALDCLFVGGQ